MRFTPREIREEVNVSRDHPLKEFFLLAGGLLGILLAVYLLLGAAIDFVVPRIGPDLEDHLGGLMLSGIGKEEEGPSEHGKMQSLLDALSGRLEDPGREYRIHIIKSEDANAVALPGGHIIVFSGLVKEARSENELAMVLGHELGHFQSRDHLRGLGRGLVLVFLSSLLFGSDSPVSRLMSSFLGGAQMRFSQRQELAADRWGLKLIVQHYGHAGGATDFFRRLSEKEGGKELSYLFASHPYPQERIAALEEMIREARYPVREVVPLTQTPPP